MARKLKYKDTSMAALSTVRIVRPTKVCIQLCIVAVAAVAAWWWFDISCSDRRNEVSRPDDVFSVELAGITNAITKNFRREDATMSHVIPCASRTLKDIKTMTNVVLRQAVARHLAKEVLAINLTNENYHLRWKNIDAAIDVIPRVHDALKYAGAPDKERCEFLFDAIQHFKEGAMATLREPMIKPTKNDLWGGRGDRWAQTNCKASVNNIFEFSPCFLNNAVFRLAYPKLPPAEQEYFKKRFREVFGIEYVPDEPNRRAYLWGTKGTLWDGKGLEWRF